MKLNLRSGLMALLLASSAIAAPRNPPPPNNGPGRGGPGGPGRGCPVYGQAVVELGRWYRDGERIPLRQIFGLDRRCDGLRVTNVSVLTMADRRSRGDLYLLVNGYTEGRSQAASPNEWRWLSFRTRRNADVLGYDIQSMEIYVQGVAFAQRVALTVEDPNNGYPPPGGGNPPPPGGGYPPPGGGGPGGPGGPRPGPGPGPGPQPQPREPIWAANGGGGYYDATGVIQGPQRLPQMRYYGGRFQAGEPVPPQQLLVNALGHVCAQPGFYPPAYGDCSAVPTHYE